MRNAAAPVHSAYLAFARTELPAPVAGFVAKRNVQLGQRVGPGAALMAVVPLDQVWVDANFKEPQLARMRVGQPVDAHGRPLRQQVVYHGTVAGFGAGTGAAFSLLPAQNATGNWIKIVQRVPVRIALDPRELALHPLQIGLSMQRRCRHAMVAPGRACRSWRSKRRPCHRGLRLPGPVRPMRGCTRSLPRTRLSLPCPRGTRASRQQLLASTSSVPGGAHHLR